MWDNLIIDGFQFQTPEAYKEAKKESESIAYIRAKTNLSDIKTTEKLYSRLSGKQSLHTIIGLCFLRELREKLLQSGTVDAGKLKCIEAMPFQYKTDELLSENASNDVSEEKQQEFKKYRREQADTQREEKFKNLAEFYRVKMRNLRIIVVIMTLVVVAMFALNLTGEDPLFADQEMQLQDKYAAWDDELKQREAAITERENQLEK